MRFLESDLSSVDYIKRLLQEGDLYQDLAKQIKIGDIHFTNSGVLTKGSLPYDPEILADFILFCWQEVFKLDKKIGLILQFDRDNLSYSFPITFDDKGIPTKFLVKAGVYLSPPSLALENLAHELIHVHQYVNEGLKEIEGKTYYKGRVYNSVSPDIDFYQYLALKHEKEAYFNEEKIVDLFKEDYSTKVFERSNTDFRNRVKEALTYYPKGVIY